MLTSLGLAKVEQKDSFDCYKNKTLELLNNLRERDGENRSRCVTESAKVL